MRGLYKVTLTKCLGVLWENAIDITLISCLFFNWLSATESWIPGKKWNRHFALASRHRKMDLRPGIQQWQVRDMISYQLFFFFYFFLTLMYIQQSHETVVQQSRVNVKVQNLHLCLCSVAVTMCVCVCVWLCKRHTQKVRERKRERESDRESGRERRYECVLTMWKDVRETRLKEAPHAHPIPPLW